MEEGYPRDLAGYGESPPFADWPGQARVCLSLAIAVEEGAEYSVLHGDAHSESILSEVAGAAPAYGKREPNIESMYEYGSRAGFWRVLRAIRGRGLSATVYAVAMALERNPAVAEASMAAGFEILSHGYRWIDYAEIPESVEREHICRSVEIIRRLCGRRPVGWCVGRPSVNSRRLAVEEGGFLYDCDSLADDLPYWEVVAGRPHLVIPHQFDTNDSKFVHTNGFAHGGQYEAYLRDSFDVLYREGEESPKMMTVSLHPRIIGRPGRIAAFERFLDYVLRHERVWVPTREQIARHWIERHPFHAGSPESASSSAPG